MTHILELCDLYPTIGINILLDKSLITEYYGQYGWRLGMHDLLQEMGKHIVIYESLNDLGRCSRLWLQEDIDDVFTKSKVHVLNFAALVSLTFLLACLMNFNFIYCLTVLPFFKYATLLFLFFRELRLFKA